MLATVPAGARVAVWVAYPEHLDYSRHRFVDVRTPQTARFRELVYGAHRSRFGNLLRGTQYMLVEREDHRVERSQGNLVHRLLCTELNAGCADDLELLLLRSRVIASDGSLQLVALPQ